MKILILKGENTDFEKVTSQYMRRNWIDVEEPFIMIGSIKKKIRAICKRLYFKPIYACWLKNWKKKIQEYDLIIHFDNDIALATVRYIHEAKPEIKQILWLWNIPKFNIELYRKYCIISCFDQFFCREHNLIFSEQFYFENIKCDKSVECLNDVIYVGKDKNRYQKLYEIVQLLNKHGIKGKFYLRKNKITSYNLSNKELLLIDYDIDYNRVIELEKKSKAILEINPECQHGLTLRTLEALFLKKKLITDNRYITNSDFYDSNNIFIYGVDDISRIEDFLNSGKSEISEDVMYKYKYDRWIKDMIKISDIGGL